VPDPPTSKFCDGCGLALPMARVTSTPRPRPDDAPAVRCRECGVQAVSRRCRNCGYPVPWPDDVLPPDELPARTVPPSLELGGEDAPSLELDDAGDGGGGGGDGGGGGEG
jgi:predicted RNA-binding Zn-ribbon protein involved in translation (DUF1610 family)